MIKVAGVKFKSAGKVYYFSPEDVMNVKVGDNVIVETARGLEYGTVTLDITEVREERIVCPLTKIVRIATEADE